MDALLYTQTPVAQKRIGKKNSLHEASDPVSVSTAASSGRGISPHSSPIVSRSARRAARDTPKRRLPFEENTPPHRHAHTPVKTPGNVWTKTPAKTPARTPMNMHFAETPDRFFEMRDLHFQQNGMRAPPPLTSAFPPGLPAASQPCLLDPVAEAAQMQVLEEAHVLASLQLQHKHFAEQMQHRSFEPAMQRSAFSPDAPVDLTAMAARISAAQRFPLLELDHLIFGVPVPPPAFTPTVEQMMRTALGGHVAQPPLPTFPDPIHHSEPCGIDELLNSKDRSALGGVASGSIVEQAKDQQGCRMLQRRITDSDDPGMLHEFFQEVLPCAVELMVDPFGNYLMQVLLRKFRPAWVREIFLACEPVLVEMCKNMHGTRAVQAMIAVLPTEAEQQRFGEILGPAVVDLAKDVNGNHVLVRCIASLPPHRCAFIYEALLRAIPDLATHKQGCCVLQRCLDGVAGPYRQRMISEVAVNALVLSQDQFGNYVVQYVLKEAEPSINWMIVQALSGHLVSLSKQKFSSNVIETILNLRIPEASNFIVEIIEQNALAELMADSFGNFVAQRMVEFASPAIRELALTALRPHVQRLLQQSGGPARGVQKLMKKYPQLRADPTL
mmetsp:Transcript_27178/g.65410  ORF Transcript_27178/g.65410 Transcript_27178/m.65410 type:complete len:612 (-) Transcript_27178:218-2053(-)